MNIAFLFLCDLYSTPTYLFLGLLLFYIGMAINIHSDCILRSLRKPKEIVYKIPTGNKDLVGSCIFPVSAGSDVVFFVLCRRSV